MSAATARPDKADRAGLSAAQPGNQMLRRGPCWAMLIVFFQGGFHD